MKIVWNLLIGDMEHENVLVTTAIKLLNYQSLANWIAGVVRAGGGQRSSLKLQTQPDAFGFLVSWRHFHIISSPTLLETQNSKHKSVFLSSPTPLVCYQFHEKEETLSCHLFCGSFQMSYFGIYWNRMLRPACVDKEPSNKKFCFPFFVFTFYAPEGLNFYALKLHGEKVFYDANLQSAF